MKVYLIILISMAIIRFCADIKNDKTATSFIASIIVIGMHILGIIFIIKV